MMRRLALASLLVVLVAAADAQQPATDRYRFERPIVTTGQRPQRLAIDMTLLSGAEPYLPSARQDMARPTASRLADLRLFGSGDAPVAHLLLYPPPRTPVWRSGEVLAIATTEKTSGFEADFGVPLTVDAMGVTGLPAPFLKRLLLEGSGDREHWTVLAGEGTLFDLPEEGLRQTELPFAPGVFRYLRVTWNDTNSGRVRLPLAVNAREVFGVVAAPTLTAPMPVERRSSEPGRSRYRIRLPVARLPLVAVDLNVPIGASGHVFRQASIFESRLSGSEAQPARLGAARLVRVVRDGIAAGALRIPIEAPLEAELDLVVEDGSNPPLEITGVTVVFRELPWIYFEAPAGPVVARYGNPSAIAPKYDLEAVRDSVKIGEVPDATWGEPRRLEAPAPAAPITSMPETGAPLDPTMFRYQRAIPDGPAELVALELDAAVLAHSRGLGGRFADVRVVDGSSRQIPYLIERRDEPLTIGLSLQRVQSQLAELKAVQGRNLSVYRVTLPFANLPSATLVLETSARVFQRTVQLGLEQPADRRQRDPWFDVTANATWTHADQQVAAQPLTLTVRESSATDRLLVVNEGDNSPLPVSAARLLLPSYRVRFYRPAAATLRLVYGREDLAPPQYDLALLAPQVMGVAAHELAAAPEAAGGAATTSPTLVSKRTFWIFLSAAVLVLLAVIVRLVKNPQ